MRSTWACVSFLVAVGACKDPKGTCQCESQDETEWCIVDVTQDQCVTRASEDTRPGKKDHPDWIKESDAAGTARCVAAGYAKLPPSGTTTDPGPDVFTKPILGTCVSVVNCAANTSNSGCNKPTDKWTPHEPTEQGIARCAAAGMTQFIGTPAEMAKARANNARLMFTPAAK